jgi:hypothetical protein
MFPAPPVPPFAPDRSALTEHSMRYEDLTQDGRLMPIAIPSTMSGLWRTILVKHAGARNAQSTGVIPLLTRLTIHSRDIAVRLNKPLEVRSGFELARGLAEGPRGGIARLYMNVWCDLRGIAIKGGELADCGAIFAEHTFTRPFAPPDQRKVTSLDVEGYPSIPEAVYGAPAPATASEPPDGATWRDELLADGRESCFSLDQTDSNQHVNSLVYIRVFLDAAQRRLPDLRVRARAVDIAYRKPSFAGDRVRAHVRLFERAGQVGAAGFIAADDGKPRCYVRAIYGA